MKHLEQRRFISDVDDFLLLLTIYLIIQRPDGHGDWGKPDGDLYVAVRQTYFQIFGDSQARPSVKLLQSGILLATYEYGHGMISQACMTLSPCIPMALSMGIHQSATDSFAILQSGQRLPEETAIVWWAIFISDRYETLSL